MDEKELTEGFNPMSEYAPMEGENAPDQAVEANAAPKEPPAASALSEQNGTTAAPPEKDPADDIPYYRPTQFQQPTDTQGYPVNSVPSAPTVPASAEPTRAIPPAQPLQSAYRPPVQQAALYQQAHSYYQPPAQQPSYPSANGYQQPYPQQGYPQPIQPQQVRPQPQYYQPYPYRRPYPDQPVQQPVPPVQQPKIDPTQNPYLDPASAYPAAPQNAYGYGAPQKPKTPTGTKVFIGVLSGLLVAVIAVFIAYAVSKANEKKLDAPVSFDTPFGFGENSPTEDNGFFNFTPYAYRQDPTEFEQDITLIEDNGETQKRSEDNPDSVGEADKNAAGVKLESLPKDKDDKKYTTQAAYESISDSVVSVVCYEDKITGEASDVVGEGSGTVISADGYIITNAHVIGNSRMYAINIILNSGDEYQAKVVGYDTWTDLAVLKIDAKNLKPVTFGDSDLIEIGDDVIAVGNPGGTAFKNSLTKGIVSAVNRELSISKNVKYIQSDCVINPGNSGGPLCNIYGQVIGITSAKIVSNVYEGMSFSIPSKTVETIVNDLIRNGFVSGRVRMGFSGYEVSDEDVYYYGLPHGVVVSEISKDGALNGTDIREGDIIYAVDDIEISTFQDIFDILSNHKPGDKVTLSVYRPEQ